MTERGRAAALLALLLVRGLSLFAQNSGADPGQLGAEITAIERRLNAGLSPAERHDALVRLARLRQLSGDITAAAACWLDAAAADPSDDAALTAGAFCLAAVGEWDTALLTIRPLLASGRQGLPVLQARYLEASLNARVSGNVSALAGLAGDPEFAAIHPLVHYTLWRIIAENPGVSPAGSAEVWKARLLAEFPQSPEARAANPGKNTATAIKEVPSPIWLLFPGNPVEQPRSAPAVPAVPASAPVVLQTGVFSREANARAQADTLQKAGFSAAVSRRPVNGVDHWAVTVAAGQNVNQTIQDLKKAGFDSFPVKN